MNCVHQTGLHNWDHFVYIERKKFQAKWVKVICPLKLVKNMLIYKDHKYLESHLMDLLEILYPRTRKLNVVQYNTMVLSQYFAWDFFHLPNVCWMKGPLQLFLGYNSTDSIWNADTRQQEAIRKYKKIEKMFFSQRIGFYFLIFLNLVLCPVAVCVSWQQEALLALEFDCSGWRNLGSVHQVHL